MSFYDELTQAKPQERPTLPDELYVNSIIEAIKSDCLRIQNEKKRHVKGFLYKHISNDWSTDYYCVIVPSIVSKQEIAKKQSGKVGESYYPYDPNSYWEGPVFNIGNETIDKIRNAFYKLGFKNASISFTKVDYEVGSSGFLYRVSFKKTGESGYLIQVDISW